MGCRLRPAVIGRCNRHTLSRGTRVHRRRRKIPDSGTTKMVIGGPRFSSLTETIPHVYTVQFDKAHRVSPLFESDFRLLRSVRHRAHETSGGKINPSMSGCVRAVCGLMSDVLTAGWNKKVLRATGYSVRSVVRIRWSAFCNNLSNPSLVEASSL